jgi:hypothetical protein
MATGYIAAAGDLDVLFKARTSAAIANTNFLSNGGVDLAQRFEPRGSTTARADTGFVSGSSDLSQLFMDIATFTGQTNTYNTPVVGATETVPAGATSVTIKIWGAGGGGGLFTGPPGGGGGGGGYTERTLSVTGGQTFTYSVGAGGAGRTAGSGNGPGTAGQNSNVISASPSFSQACNGAQAGTQSAGGAGGTVSNIGGSVSTNGSTGGVPTGGAAAGGGGGSAGTAGSNGNAPGGGGAGAITSGGTGGTGANCRIQFIYT